ncbi:MAG: hypothetical protein KAG34_03830 [Cocleimonas sp.]|nr:hypothetical protein [Cocleimonas sp.]
MELQQLKEIIACLSGERNVFYYFRDRYALMLLKDYIGDASMPINQLRQSPYAKLLNKAMVKRALGLAGNGIINAEQLEMIWDEKPLAFVTSLSQWGEGAKDWRWNQMSRKGYHLVLQLNMATDHTEQFEKLVKPDDLHTFNMCGHPTMDEGQRETLAWVRLDLDFETNEVLIEEIQCDWVGEVREAVRDGDEWYGDYSEEELQTYANVILAPYAKVWEEAMLAATIDFIRHDLGIDTIYYHSFETGAVLKNITYTKPPRSLYTKLPSRFAFQKTEQGPEFLMRDKYVCKRLKKVKQPHWFTLPKAA